MIDDGKSNLLGIQVNAIDYEAAVAQIIEAAKNKSSLTVSALAVHGLMEGFLDPEMRYRLNRFDLLCPDGQPVRWGLRWLHDISLSDRVYGPFLTLKTCQKAAQENLSIFCYGSSDEVLDQLIPALQKLAPGLRIAGRQASRFRQASPQEVAEDFNTINDSNADIVLVGLGCPRQEIWCYEMHSQIPRPMLAVGAAFDFHAGNLKMAPAWMQARGLEWLFRLVLEPTRLWKRYLLLNPLYLFHLAKQKISPKSYQLGAGEKEPSLQHFG